MSPNYDKHKKRYSVIIETLKNNLTHATLCPVPTKLFEQIQILKLQ